jgi:hypothetical protein
MLVPVLYWFLKKSSLKRETFFLVLFMIFFSIGLLYDYFAVTKSYSNASHGFIAFAMKCFSVTIVPYLYCFLMGVLIRFHLNKIQNLIVGWYKFLIYLVTYPGVVILFQWFGGSSFSPVLQLLLALIVASFAFGLPQLCRTLLDGRDFSYGIYTIC